MYLYDRQLSVGFVQPSIVHALGDAQPRATQTYAGQPAIRRSNDSNFWNIFRDRNRVVVVSFWSDACRPCDEVAKIIATLAENNSKTAFRDRVSFYQVQWDPKVNPQIHQRFGLKGIPVVYFYYTATGNPPSRTAPLLEGSLGPSDKFTVPEEYEWRIKSILRRHGHTFEARITLIDLANFFTNKATLREQLVKALEAKFNNLDAKWLFEQLLRFRVVYRSTEPTSHEKASFSRLDFPIYLLGQQHPDTFVKKLVREHQIPSTIECRNMSPFDPFDRVNSCWNEKQDRGCGIPPGQGFRKVGFIKTHTVATDPIGKHHLGQAFLNVTSHELGHMLNICDHSSTGLMKSPVALNVNLDFPLGYKGFVLETLRRLRDF